jgi:hypothetical protein
VKETMATTFNQHGYGDEDANTSNPKVWKNKEDPSNLLQNKEKNEKENKQRKKGRIYLLYSVILDTM